jgi:phosphocarrier protein HPr
VVKEATREVTILNTVGLHLRPAALLVKLANNYKADIFLVKDGMEVNAKSIMGVMMLAAEMGSKIIVKADGNDAEDAVEALSELVLNKFNDGESA